MYAPGEVRLIAWRPSSAVSYCSAAVGVDADFVHQDATLAKPGLGTALGG